jgi:hypothetical protein
VTRFPVFGADSRFARCRLLPYGDDAQEARIPYQFINMEVDVMRELTEVELAFVAGGNNQQCTPSDSGNNYAGVSDTSSVGKELVEIYEGVVAATSHIIERVANAL